MSVRQGDLLDPSDDRCHRWFGDPDDGGDRRILTYEAQLNRWALRDYRADPPSTDGAPLGLDELIAGVSVGPPGGRVTSVTLRRDPREPAMFRLEDGATVFLDRFTGEPRGDGNTATRRFLRSVMYWHRWFALEGEYRIVGRTLTATANLGFLFLLVSGLYLWWPSAASRVAWRQVLWFRRGLSGRARNFNWHSVIGFWRPFRSPSSSPAAPPFHIAGPATSSTGWPARHRRLNRRRSRWNRPRRVTRRSLRIRRPR